MDFSTLKLGRKPNQFLMAPEGLCKAAVPHATSPVFDVPATDLLHRLVGLARGEERVSVADVSEDALSAKFVARSKVFRFPDMIDCQVVAIDGNRSALAVYSRARYGIRDFGVNRARIEDWVQRLQTGAN